MPLYDYRCSCAHSFSRHVGISRRKEAEGEECPECHEVGKVQHVIGATPLIDPIRLGRIKPSSGFNEVLRNIKRGNKGSNINIRD